MKVFKYTITLVISILLLIGIYLGNNYIREERLFFYSTGSDIKAFVNSTWEMSEKEIDRVCSISFEDAFKVYKDSKVYLSVN